LDQQSKKEKVKYVFILKFLVNFGISLFRNFRLI